MGKVPDSELLFPICLSRPLWKFQYGSLGVTDEDILGRPILTTEEGYNAGILFYYVKDGILKVRMPAYSGAVFTSHPEDFYPVLRSRFVEDGEEAKEKERPRQLDGNRQLKEKI